MEEVKTFQEENKPKSRSSNLELYRIITMFLIVAHHYVVNSGMLDLTYIDPTSPRTLFLLIFGAFGKTGINCFMMITGYFMCKSEITLKKFLKLLLEVELYKIIIWVIFAIAGYQSVSLKGLLTLLIPFKTISNGFTSCYLFFFLFIPFLNILVRNMNEKQHVKLLILSVFMYVIVGSVPGFGIVMNYVTWFSVIYFIASYIRMYDKKIFNNTLFWGVSTLVILFVSVLSVVVLSAVVGRGFHFFLSDSNKILAVALAISSFLFFKNLKMKNSRFINTVAASAFGVLMIHANSNAMRQWLWVDLLHNVEMYYSEWLIVHAFGSVIGIYIVCTAIDFLRIRFIEKPVFKLLDKPLTRLTDGYKKVEANICKKLHIGGNEQ